MVAAIGQGVLLNTLAVMRRYHLRYLGAPSSFLLSMCENSQCLDWRFEVYVIGALGQTSH